MYFVSTYISSVLEYHEHYKFKMHLSKANIKRNKNKQYITIEYFG